MTMYRSPTFRRNLAFVLQLPGYMGVLSAATAVLFGEYIALIPFLGIAVFTLTFSWIIIRRTSVEEGNKRITNPLLFAAFSYGIVSLIGAIPIYITAFIYAKQGLASPDLLHLQDILNSLFESFAGFTSTGLTMIDNPETAPRSLLLWRSMSQWAGGLGVIILAIFIFAPKMKGLRNLVRTEVGDIQIDDSIHHTSRTISLIYISLTVLAAILFMIAGDSLWVSINHALTCISTGGFTVTNESFANQSLASKYISLLLMLAGALGFDFYRELFASRKPGVLIRHKENFWFVCIMFTSASLFLLGSFLSTASPPLLDSIYQWISAITTSGYQTTELGEWGNSTHFLLSLAMAAGGVAGSTAGGLKIRRLLLLAYVTRYNLSGNIKNLDKKITSLGEGETREESILNLTGFLVLWLFIHGISIILVSILTAGEYDLAEVIFEITSALSNVGLTTGLTSPDMHWLIKLDFMVLMWMGRLELVAVLFLFTGWFRQN